MIRLQVRAGVGQASAPLVTDIRNFQLVQTVDGVFAVSTTGSNGGLVSYALHQGAAASVQDSQNFNASVAAALNGNLFRFGGGGQDVLLVGDSPAGGVLGYGFGVDGRFSALTELDGLSVAAQELPTSVSAFYDSGAGFVFMAAAGGDAFGCYTEDGLGGFRLEAEIADTAGRYGRDVGAITGGQVGGQIGGEQIMLVASRAEAGISSYRLNPNSGTLVLSDSLGAAEGLGILATIAGLEMITAYGHSYVIVASSATQGESGALSVLEVLPGGALQATDHLLDSRDSRFGQVQSLAVVEADGRVYVLAGGGDDGVSLLVLLPGGRLQHLDSLADTAALALDNVSAIVAAQVGDELQVLVAAQGEAGVTQLVFSLADQGVTLQAADSGGVLSGGDADDILVGGSGNDTLSGGAGDDIIVDGAGSDLLTGGAGADIFVLQGDAAYDRIADFEAGKDRLDLSDFPMFYDPSLLEIETTSTGAIISWKGIETELLRAGGGGLSAGQVRVAVLSGPDRPLLVLNHEGPGADEDGQELLGSAVADVLQGQSGADVIWGLGGSDALYGQLGDDLLLGGAQNDTLEGGDGNDTVHGGDGRDRALLGAGNDVFYDNAQTGDFGRDTVLAGAGNDTIIGGSGSDVFHGQLGGDFIWAGAGQDLLSGGVGNDSLTGQGGADTIWGGTGQDTLRGGDQDDLLYGREDNDVLIGGNGRDLVWMGDGDDVFYDNSQGGDFGRDTVFGGAGKDTIEGGGGNDVAYGEGANDLLIGRRGDDRLYGGPGNDTLYGGDGNDTVAGGIGGDKVWLGAGNDFWFDSAQSGGGDDYVEAGSGNDTLRAQGGDDTLVGGTGADHFVFVTGMDDDVIVDYEVGLDSLQFSSALWNGALSQSALLARATVVEGDLLLSLDTGDTLRLDGVATLAGLLDDISLM